MTLQRASWGQDVLVLLLLTNWARVCQKQCRLTGEAGAHGLGQVYLHHSPACSRLCCL